MATLDEIRNEITQLDADLLALLARRRQLSLEVARSKQADQRPIRDTRREQDLLVRLIQQGRALGLSAQYVTQLYHLVIEDSVLTQQDYLQRVANPAQAHDETSVAYLGPLGSYSSLAARKYLGRYSQVSEHSCSNFAQVIEAVENGRCQFGVLPIENTSSGSINEVYDLMQQTSLSIVGELTYPIEHCLLVAVPTELEAIERLYGHPQPLQQCSRYLAQHPNIHHVFCDSSSAAMAKVQALASPTAAAIGSADGGKLFGLTAIASGLANQQENMTRFIVVATKPIEVVPQVPAKTTLIMSTNQYAGALVEVLLVLRNHKINMTKLESRPIQGNPWEEMFYMDVAANLHSEAMQKALQELYPLTRSLKVLGCYPSEDVAPTEIAPALMP